MADKRITGAILLVAGIILLIVSLGADVIGLGAGGRFGAQQILGLIAGLLLIFVGLIFPRK